jgi:NADH:ubiquinone oxidoreductase subunit K
VAISCFGFAALIAARGSPYFASWRALIVSRLCSRSAFCSGVSGLLARAQALNILASSLCLLLSVYLGIVCVVLWELLYTTILRTISISRFYSASKKSRVSLCYCVTGHNLEEDIVRRPHGQSISPNGGKTLYIGNREMSDKSRNGL